MWLNKPASLLCCGLAQVRTVNEKHCYLNVVKSNSCQMPLDTLLHVWAQVSVNQCCMQFRVALMCLPVWLVEVLGTRPMALAGLDYLDDKYKAA